MNQILAQKFFIVNVSQLILDADLDAVFQAGGNVTMIMTVVMALMKIPAQRMSTGHVLKMKELVTMESAFIVVNGVMAKMIVVPMMELTRCSVIFSVAVMNLDVVIPLIVSTVNGGVMVREIVRMVVMKKTVQNLCVALENSLVLLLLVI